MRLERNDTGHQRVRESAPRDTPARNLKQNLENSAAFVAICMPSIRKLALVDSSYVAQRCDEFRQILNTRPLLIGTLDRSLDHDGCSRGRKRGNARGGSLHHVVRLKSAHIVPSQKRGSTRR